MSVPFWESTLGSGACVRGGAKAGLSLCCTHLRFLTRYGTSIAFRNGMNSEMNTGKAAGSEAAANLGSIPLSSAGPVRAEMERVNLDMEGVRAMRHHLHELANVFTGV